MRSVLGFCIIFILGSSLLFPMQSDEHKESSLQLQPNGNANNKKDEKVLVDAQLLLNWAVENAEMQYAEKALQAGASAAKAVLFCKTLSMLKFLMAKGLHLSNQQILDWAVFRNDDNLALQVISTGAQPDKALRYCCTSAMLTTLVSGGLLVDGISPSLGRTPLYYFLDPQFPIDAREQENILNTLLLLGADPNFVITGSDQYGKSLSRTALHKAVYLKRLDLVRLLVEKNAALDVQDNKGSTPLHVAVQENAWDIIQYLVDRGASLRVKDNNGATPYDLALQHERYDIIEYLDRAQYVHGHQVIAVSPVVQTSSQASSHSDQAVTVSFSNMSSHSESQHASSTSSTNSSNASSMASASDQSVVVTFSPTFNEQSVRRSSEERKAQAEILSNYWLRRPSNLWRAIIRVDADSWQSQTQDHSWRKPQ